MSDSVEVEIVNDIVAALGNIQSADGDYFTDQVRIYQMYGSIFEVPERPCYIVLPLQSMRHHACPNGLEGVNLRLSVVCVMDSGTDGSLSDDNAELDRQIRHMANDVEKAVQVDRKRGERAIDTLIESVDVYPPVQGTPLAAAEVSMMIPFRHLTADPTQAQ